MSKYTVKDDDDCHSISKSQRVSTFDLTGANNLPAYCSGFPEAGADICIPESCDVYTVQENDTCFGIVGALDSTVSIVQLQSWNPPIDRACSNLDVMVGYEICVRYVTD